MEDSVELRSPLLIVGLGNPGPDYASTRHNTGWRVIDRLARELGAEWRRTRAGEVADATIGDSRLTLLKPQTFMNKSGLAVVEALGGRDASANNLIVISDDVAVKLGSWRWRQAGGHGGHNGVRSIIEQIGPDFLRLRVGIGPVPEHFGRESSERELDKYVLGRLSETEETSLKQLLDDLVPNLIESVRSGQVILATKHSN